MVTHRIVELVSTGAATSRADLARTLAISPSTVSLRVQELVDAGVLYEHSHGVSRGGRPPRTLRLHDHGGYVGVAEIGSHHARVGIIGLTGRLDRSANLTVDATAGPEPTLRSLASTMSELGVDVPGDLRAVAVALAAPVDAQARTVVQASRLATWNGYPVGDWLEKQLDVPTVVENDVNAMALGEHYERAEHGFDSVTVKAGSAIGSGLIVDGRIYRGSTSNAGDITHTRVASAGDTPCSCGNLGCLETVASAAGIIRLLRERGVAVSGTPELVTVAGQGHAQAMSLVRSAGRHLGEVLSTVVNFVNPGAVYLGGALSTLEPFVAAVRSQLYEGCHPLATRDLVIEPTRTGADAGVIGAGRLALTAAFADSAAERTP
ncbi:ROK family transcriptional regulator [Natronosporangium hydrolyticum]|uniref:ROK family transcriptional regulator n=1 Tax=Natronosporangium hydrolyticum TaxID=2811111 RepID=A0A895YKX6_9ACTN|nr:ROK family transcriptional regulator [Natronosporangium hydrolyticum]QSB16635.1 ROK family transcriptional regulator [Natronosporangium hydrolyticum]